MSNIKINEIYIIFWVFYIDSDYFISRKLITINPDNYVYIFQIIETKGLQSNKEIFEYLKTLEKQFPSSNAIKRIQLNYVEGNDFKSQFLTYIKPFF